MAQVLYYLTPINNAPEDLIIQVINNLINLYTEDKRLDLELIKQRDIGPLDNLLLVSKKNKIKITIQLLFQKNTSKEEIRKGFPIRGIVKITVGDQDILHRTSKTLQIVFNEFDEFLHFDNYSSTNAHLYS